MNDLLRCPVSAFPQHPRLPCKSCRPSPQCRAETTGQGGTDTGNRGSAPAERTGRAGGDLPGGRPRGLKLEKIERLGEEAWAGVAGIDRGDSVPGFKRVALLAGGDAAALMLFAATGRANHGESLDPASVLSVAWPFLAGWFGAASLLGGFGKEARGSRVRPAALAALKCWAVGIPVGIALRSASRGYLPDRAFVIVTLAVTAVFLIGWRSGLAAFTPQEPSAATQANSRQNKRGNPLEFLSLLSSLTKRW